MIDPVPSPKKTHCSANRKVFIRSLDSHEVLVQNTKLSLETVPRSLLQKVPPLWVCGNKQNETQSVRTSSADKWRSTLCTAGIIHTKSRFLLHFLAQRTTRPNFQCHFQFRDWLEHQQYKVCVSKGTFLSLETGNRNYAMSETSFRSTEWGHTVYPGNWPLASFLPSL